MDKNAIKYKEMKKDHPEDILLYQVGIFYKIMFEDAKKVAEPLGLKLLVSGEDSDPVRSCGFPQSGLDKYVGKLVRAEFGVAICHQKKDEKGEVTREVTEVIRCLKNETGSAGRDKDV